MSSDTGERRLAPVYLFLSALAFAGIAIQEGYTDRAVSPLPGDKPTYGLGSTVRTDGKPVQAGDRITPPAAITLAVRDITAKEAEIKACVTAPMHQYEYDAVVSLAYNVGTGAFCSSTLVKKLNALDYAGACAEILRWRFFQGKDCADANNRCGGLWLRRRAEYQLCQGERP